MLFPKKPDYTYSIAHFQGIHKLGFSGYLFGATSGSPVFYNLSGWGKPRVFRAAG